MTAKTQKSVSSNRREVGAALRSFRRRAGFERVEDVAEFIDVSAVTMGRIEKGEAPIDRAKLGVLATKYNLNDHERDALTQLARETRGRRGTFKLSITCRPSSRATARACPSTRSTGSRRFAWTARRFSRRLARRRCAR